MPKAYRGVKELAQDLTADQIDERFAEACEKAARQIRQATHEMRELGVPAIRPIPGGLQSAIEKIAHLIDTQIQTKVRVAARVAARRDQRERRLKKAAGAGAG